MLSLRGLVGDVGAIVMPMQLVLANTRHLHAKIFNPNGVVISNIYEFEIHPDDFIHTAGSSFTYEDVETGPGYIRDYNERHDGERPEVKTAVDMRVARPVVTLKTNILISV